MGTFQTTMYVCDNPSCGQTVPAHDTNEPALGFHGKTLQVHEAGGDSAEWYAHAAKCIGPAVRAAFENSNMTDPAQAMEFTSPPADPEPAADKAVEFRERVHGPSDDEPSAP